MKIGLKPVVIGNILLDLLPLGYAIVLTVIGASATNVPDAGLVVVVTVPLILLFAADMLVLFGLGVKHPNRRKLTILLAYYALTRAALTYVVIRLLINNSVGLVAVLGAMLALTAYTLRSIETAR